MFSKVRVGGDDAAPVYRYLTSLPEPIGGPVKWNFEKYLVDREGRVVARFASRVAPGAPELVSRIEELLSEPRPAARSAQAR
jgi:glutathione peroxidase